MGDEEGVRLEGKIERRRKIGRVGDEGRRKTKGSRRELLADETAV